MVKCVRRYKSYRIFFWGEFKKYSNTNHTYIAASNNTKEHQPNSQCPPSYLIIKTVNTPHYPWRTVIFAILTNLLQASHQYKKRNLSWKTTLQGQPQSASSIWKKRKIEFLMIFLLFLYFSNGLVLFPICYYYQQSMKLTYTKL